MLPDFSGVSLRFQKLPEWWGISIHKFSNKWIWVKKYYQILTNIFIRCIVELFFCISNILFNSEAEVCIFTAVGLASTSSHTQHFILEIKSSIFISLKISSDERNLTAILKQPTIAMAGAPLTFKLLHLKKHKNLTFKKRLNRI